MRFQELIHPLTGNQASGEELNVAGISRSWMIITIVVFIAVGLVGSSVYAIKTLSATRVNAIQRTNESIQSR